MAETLLVSTDTLAAHLNNPNWVIVDCRFNLADTEAGFREYQHGHIPGAIYAHLDRDLSGTKGPSTGRHPLPEIDHLVDTFSTFGIDSNKQVVAYDSAGGSFADRLWWLLRLLGHSAVAILDGGFPKWAEEKQLVQVGIESIQTARFQPHLQPNMFVKDNDIEWLHANPEFLLIDARATERYRGDIEPLDAVAGHIPGAINRFYNLNLSPDGTFKPGPVLREEFSQLLGNTPPQNVIAYCGSGVTSIHHLLAMELAGLSGARLYAGSWSQWIRDPNHPVATGSEKD